MPPLIFPIFSLIQNIVIQSLEEIKGWIFILIHLAHRQFFWLVSVLFIHLTMFYSCFIQYITVHAYVTQSIQKPEHYKYAYNFLLLGIT